MLPRSLMDTKNSIGLNIDPCGTAEGRERTPDDCLHVLLTVSEIISYELDQGNIDTHKIRGL